MKMIPCSKCGAPMPELRFNKHAGGAAGQNSNEWLQTTTKNGREFIRKWGHFIKHDPLMKPIIPPKYNIGFIVKKCNSNLLEVLEPWCDSIYIKDDMQVLTTHYLDKEQPNTSFNLNERIKLFDDEKNNEILVTIDGNKFTQQDFQIIQQLSEILKDSGEIGGFQLGNLFIDIIQMNEYQNTLIKI